MRPLKLLIIFIFVFLDVQAQVDTSIQSGVPDDHIQLSTKVDTLTHAFEREYHPLPIIIEKIDTTYDYDFQIKLDTNMYGIPCQTLKRIKIPVMDTIYFLNMIVNGKPKRFRLLEEK